MQNIVNETLNILSVNKEWHERYEKYLSDIWGNPSKGTKGFRKPDGLSVYTTVRDRNKQIYYLRFKGQNVGKVVRTKDGIKLYSLTKESKSHEVKDCPLTVEQPVEWSSKEASLFRKFFKTLSNDTHIKSPEHYIENSLLKEFRKRSSTDKAMLNIQPVLLHENFFQMPTPIKASSHIPYYAGFQGGGIDMLTRIRTVNGHVRLCIMEIKDENKREESQKAAMTQAIIYSIFIVTLLEKQPDWMEFFMGHKSKYGRLPRTLDRYDIEVVTVMPAGETETLENETLNIPNTKYNLHCHSLFYDKMKFETSGIFEFSGTFLNEISK